MTPSKTADSTVPRGAPTPPIDLAAGRRDYLGKGYCLVDDFLPLEVANQLADAFEAASFEPIDQVRDHYQHVFATARANFPGPDEQYLAKLGRSRTLEAAEGFSVLFDRYFKPALKEISQAELSRYDVRCYRLAPGDFYRTHIDDYAGDVGSIYYVNRRWRWDWGGILAVGDDPSGETVTPIFPRFNRMVFLSHEKFRFPHYVSVVSPYALQPRYTVVSFNS